jgi:pyrroline-5-carboxylate reductase
LYEFVQQDGLVSKGAVSSAGKIACADPNEAFVNKQKEKGYIATTENSDVCKKDIDAIVICVKPQIVVAVCKDILTNCKTDALIISVAAGVTLHTLEENLPGRRVVRVMPNTACLVGESASGFAMGTYANSNDRTIVERIFCSVGIALEQKEELLNAVTGLSGSGPAYVFQFIEALADGTLDDTYFRFPLNIFAHYNDSVMRFLLAGVRVGLARNDALKLAAQTVKGAAEMVLSTGSSPAVLKDQGIVPK